jgi:ribose/xylose/arabinose/galactoside ABC-type transport system permease subunit
MSASEVPTGPVSVAGGRKALPRIPVRFVPVLASLSVFVLMFVGGAIHYPGFANEQVFLNLFIDNSFLLVVAVGMTFVILTGGIDLSVGSMVSLSTLLCAELVKHGWSPFLAFAAVLVAGAALGLGQGCIIHYFEIQPFIVTLAGMFLARGLCFTITDLSVPVDQSTYVSVAERSVNLSGGYYLSTGALIAIVVTLVGMYVLTMTRFGRNVYAVGGSEQSALLMGLPLARTKIGVYTISGICSALGGILLSFYMLSGSGSLAVGLELDAIAAVVIGGTILTGGTGYLAGTVVGVLVLGIIKTLINFQGTLSSWWVKIATAVLVLAFILLQRLVFRGERR